MQDLSLHILDIAENSLSAGADTIGIRIHEDRGTDLLMIEVSDNGRGMDEETAKNVFDPFYTTRTTRRVGLGVPLLAQVVKECDGDMRISTEKGRGTTITATFQYSHIDRKPIGDIAETVTVIIAAHPDVNLAFEYRKEGDTYTLDTREIKKELEDVPINTPAMLKYIKKDIKAWLNNPGHMK